MATDALALLRASDPARTLAPLSEEERLARRDAATSAAITASWHKPRARFARIAVAFALVLLVVTGVAWAAGALGPLELLQKNPQSDGSSAHGLWDQHVIPASVAGVGAVSIPRIGQVQFFYGRSAQGGWCAALQLPSREWLGTSGDKVDAGGVLPGCFPTREMVNGAASPPVYVLTGFDYVESDVDARSLGGEFWRILYGLVTAPGAVRVHDLATGRSAPVIRRNLFLLAIPDPDPTKRNDLHLVAYNAQGKVVADDCPQCSSH
jgi:hypothetical protein